MQKSIVDVINQTMIAPGYNNYSGLQFTELIKVSSIYLATMNDVGGYRDGGEDLIDGDGIASPDGYDSFTWMPPGITFAQWNYFRTSILGGKRSGKVTVRTRKFAAPDSSEVPDIWVIANAVLTLPPQPDSTQSGFGFPEFGLSFTRVVILSEDTMNGEITISGGSTAQENIGTTAVLFTGFDTDGVNNGVTVSATSDNLTVVVAGNYELQFDLEFTSDASWEWTFTIYKNGATTGIAASKTVSTVADTISFGRTIALVASDIITCYVNNDDGGDTGDITAINGRLSLTSK